MIRVFSKPTTTILAFILLVAGFLRFYQLPSNPPSLNWDEVAFGYNAYSIVKTGKDEYGKLFPRYFRSLDDYKLPVNTYLIAGAILVFGYSDFSVRFPSAFFGTLTVLLVFFLVKALASKAPNIKEKMITYGSVTFTSGESIGLLASLLLAILPWHIQFSRMSAEANIGLFFMVLTVTSFLYGISKHPQVLPVASIAFGLSIYSYLSFRVVLPLLGLAAIILYWKELWQVKKKYVFISICIAVFFGVFLLYDTFFQSGHIRLKATNILTTQDSVDIFKHKEKEMYEDAKRGINIPRRIFHDTKTLTSADIILRGYLTHFSPTFLFFDYDQKQHHIPFVGLCYIFMLPLLLIGMYGSPNILSKKSAAFLFAWFLIAPIPASVTWDIPHAIRVYGMAIPIVVFTSIGVVYIFGAIKKHIIVLGACSGIVMLSVMVSTYYFFHQYMVHLPVERSKDWVYGRKEMTEFLEKHKNEYDKIIVSTSLEWPYIFMLYYSKYDPEQYIKQGGTKSGGFAEEGNTYDKYEFHKFRSEDLHKQKTLFVGKPNEFIEDIRPLHVIQYLDGTRAIYIAEGDGKI